VLSLERYKSAHEESSGDVRRLKTLAEQQKVGLWRKSQPIVNIQKDYHQILRALKKERQENAGLSLQLENGRKSNSLLPEIKSKIESLHAVLSHSDELIRTVIHQLLSILEPLFNAFSLHRVGHGFKISRFQDINQIVE
jgi:hypothetical protein